MKRLPTDLEHVTCAHRQLVTALKRPLPMLASISQSLSNMLTDCETRIRRQILADGTSPDDYTLS